MIKFNLNQKNVWKVIAFSIFSIASIYPSSLLAAETLVLKIGPLERSLQVNDLADFAEDGEISNSLLPYTPFLTTQLQQLLNRTIEVDPAIGDKFVEELSRSSIGEALLERIMTAIPGSSIEILQGAIALAIRQTSNLNIVNVLQAYPEETITLDLTRVLGIALQINGSHLQSQMINPIVDKALKQDINPDDLPPLNPANADDMQIFQRTINFNDRSRNRQIPVDIYYNDNTQAPLVVMSHGFSSNRQFLRYLAIHLASHGFTVVSVEHIGSNVDIFADPSSGFDFSQLLNGSEFADRPQDITFVLDQLAEINQDHQTLAGKLNTENVTVIGHSFGGYTALALGGAELNLKELREYCDKLGTLGKSPADWLQYAAQDLQENRFNLKDNRIKSAIALNPLVGELFGETGLTNIEIPTLILASGDDAITPSIHNQLRPFDKLTTEKYLIVALGATHLSATDDRYTDDNNITNELIGDDAENLKEMMKGVSLAFITQFNTTENTYEAFLAADYVQSLSNNQIQLRFTEEIPSSLKNWLNGISLAD